MRNAKSVMGMIACSILTYALVGQAASAQSLIVNAPSTDVLPKQQLYVEFGIVTHPERHSDGGFQSYEPHAVYGVGRGLEVGVHMGMADARDPDQPVGIQPNVKWQFYNNEAQGVAAAAGAVLNLPVRHRRGTDTFGMLYTTVSKKAKGEYGPRLTTGLYRLGGRAGGSGTSAGAIVGYEQPLHSRVGFVADWLSGRNEFGAVGAGFNFTVSRHGAVFVGYSVGNQGRKNNSLAVSYGWTF